MKKMFNKIISSIRKAIFQVLAMLESLLRPCTGDLATNTIGAIIVAVVIVGLLITAINAFFPSFFTSMFNSMSTKLNANW